MGLIFPWTYLWAPGALPAGRLVWGILLAMIFEIPIALTYVWLSTALPRSGGDYVFQSRVFGGGVGFAVVMSGFVIWILQWVALSGWLLSYLGFASLFLGLGGTMGNPTLTSLGVWFTTPWAIVIVSILNALLAMLLLVRNSVPIAVLEGIGQQGEQQAGHDQRSEDDHQLVLERAGTLDFAVLLGPSQSKRQAVRGRGRGTADRRQACLIELPDTHPHP